MEHSKAPAGVTRKAIFLFLMVPTVFLGFFYRFSAQLDDPYIVYSYNTTNYIIYNPKCRIPNMDPFNPEVKRFYKKLPYVPCTKHKLLTFIKKSPDNTQAVLHVRENMVKSYSKRGVKCCISEVHRRFQDDKYINITACKEFTNNVTVTSCTVLVKCRDKKSNKELYKNTHYIYLKTKKILQKIEDADKSTRPLSVLIVGIDSISRINFKRAMPKTRNFLIENNWLEMKGYNKIGDNTFPNLMAILSGKNGTLARKTCEPQNKGGMDNCDPFLWYEFRKRGYVTTYAEDTPSINTFNYGKEGFTSEPVDYYLRPYFLAAQDMKKVVVDEVAYCAGPESYGERVMNAVQDFSTTFNDSANFGFFWMNSFSHNKLNAPTRMDDKVRRLLDSMKHSGVLENTAVFFISDHGLRFGDILTTRSGWLEERLPFFFIWMPQWFRETYPLEYENLRENTNRLTTPFDFYMTLQDILAYSGRNFTVRTSESCAKCKSLFKEIELFRSCEDAGIPKHWCACEGYSEMDVNNGTVQEAGEAMIKVLNTKISSFKEGKQCAKYYLKHIKSAWISDHSDHWYHNDTYIIIIIEVSPYALFEGTIKINANSSYPIEDIRTEEFGRLDRYYSHSQCVKESNIKFYCYCKKKAN